MIVFIKTEMVVELGLLDEESGNVVETRQLPIKISGKLTQEAFDELSEELERQRGLWDAERSKSI